jgi:hypothetical protein
MSSEPMTTLPLTKVERDPDFRLTEGERQRLRRRFDHDALERLLAHVPPERREGILECFRIPEGNEVRELWFIGAPELQSILDEVWAPIWMGRTVEEIEADETERPGKRLAIERKRRDPDPHVVLLAVLEAMDRERWDEVARWIEPPSTSMDDLSDLRAHWIPVQRRRTVVNIVPEGEETAHVLYREREQRTDGTWGDGTVRVNTVRRTGQGWRVLMSDLVAQARPLK